MCLLGFAPIIDKCTECKEINYRTEKNNYLTFSKKKDAKTEGSTRKCPGCNANIDSNSSGKCPYCGTFYDTANYDWILEDIR